MWLLANWRFTHHLNKLHQYVSMILAVRKYVDNRVCIDQLTSLLLTSTMCRSYKLLKVVITKEKSSLQLNSSLVIFLSIGIASLAFFSGTLYGKVSVLEKGAKTQVAVQPAAGQQQQAQQPAQPQVSIDSIKGLFDKNVIKFGKGDKKLVMVEVADPSCPFCHVAAGLNGELNKQMGKQFILTAD